MIIELIKQTVNKIENLIKEQLPESKYQFELHDLITNTKHFRGLAELFHWGSVYKLFVVAEIIKMSEEGLLHLDDELILHKELFQRGNGIVKFMTHLNKLTYIDACKMVIATSDNLCADELTKVVGFERFNKLFKNAGCKQSNLTLNLDNLVSKLFLGINFKNTNGKFYRSKEFYEYFEPALDDLLKENYTNVKDLNNCWHYLLNNYYFTQKSLKIFKECFQLYNVHSRFTYYTAFSKFSLLGKTGTLGLAIVNNEIGAITQKGTNEIFGFFSILTKDNKNRYYQSSDVLALIGLEIANLYEQLYGIVS